MKTSKPLIALILLTLILTAFPPTTTHAASKPVTISIKNTHKQIVKKQKISVKATLKNAKVKKVTYTSNNKKSATVSTKGMLTAKKPGTVKVTAKIQAKDGKTYTRTTNIYIYNKKSQKKSKWIPEKGHWQNVTKKKWVSNWVTVIITPESTKQVYDYSTYVFAYDGYTTTSGADCDAHAVELVLAGNPSNFTETSHYKTVTTPAITQRKDKGSYKKVTTGRKWVVDKKGYWK